MGGHDDAPGVDFAVIGAGGGAHQLPDGGVLVDGQPSGELRRELEGVELGLVGEPDGPGHGKGEGQMGDKLSGGAQGLQGGQLPLQLVPPVQGVDIGVLLLEMAGDVPAEPAVLLQRGLVGFQVQLRLIRAKPPDQFIVDEPVLGRELGGGVGGDAAAQPPGLHQGAVRPGPGQHPGAQKARHAPADDEHIDAEVTVEGGKGGQLRCI